MRARHAKIDFEKYIYYYFDSSLKCPVKNILTLLSGLILKIKFIAKMSLLSSSFQEEETIIYTNCEKEWWVNGKRHKEDGPAVFYKNKLEWWSNGKRHNPVNPAVEYINGDKEWWFEGKPHKEDGPAIDFKEYKEWWIKGVEVDEC